MNKSPFSDLKIMVCGEVCIDRYTSGTCNRQSPEFDVPVINDIQTKNFPGMAANVVMNLRALGAKADLYTVVGEISPLTDWLYGQCRDKCVFVHDPSRPTIEKIRLISNDKHLARIDIESRKAVSKGVGRQYLDQLCAALPNYDAVVLQDYNKGLWTMETLKFIKHAWAGGKKVFVDPGYGRGLQVYTGAYLVKLNSVEATAQSTSVTSVFPEDIAYDLQCVTRIPYVCITLGAKGMVCAYDDGRMFEPANRVDCIDVCGAGDTALSALCLAMTKNYGLRDAMILANRAAGLSVQQAGPGKVSWTELFQ